MNTSEKFTQRLANYCYYDFDSLEDCRNCPRKEKCWRETIELLQKEDGDE